MIYSLSSNKELMTEELRAEFQEAVRDELSSREPSEAVKGLFGGAEQLEFKFTFAKKTGS